MRKSSMEKMKKQKSRTVETMEDRLLLHACCADCTVKFTKSLEAQTEFSEIVLYFDNSNIHPRTEYLARLDAMKKVVDDLGLKMIVADWSPKIWFETIGNDIDNPELRRCKKCWKFRLGLTKYKANELGMNYFSTTLLTSHYQSYKDIVEIGEKLSDSTLQFYSIAKTEDNIPTSGFYKQNYCGCCYSLVKRYEEKFGISN